MIEFGTSSMVNLQQFPMVIYQFILIYMMYFITERNRDFMARCHEVARQWRGKTPLTRVQIVEKALSLPAPGYYVSFNHACRCIGRLRNGKLPDKTSPIKRQMWNEIDAKVRKHQQRHPNDPLTIALAFVLTTSASRFFIDPVYARRLFYHLNNPYASKIKNTPRSNILHARDSVLHKATIGQHREHRNAC
jgi:hypothetical protein